MAFTYEDITKLNAIHHKVMRDFHYQLDKEKFRLEDFWEGDAATPGQPKALRGHFDCEEAAIQFMLFAMKEGFDARLVQMVFQQRLGHLICEVATKERDDARFLDMNYRQVNRRGHYSSGWVFSRVSPWNPRPGNRLPWRWVDKQDAFIK